MIDGRNSLPMKFSKIFDDANFKHREMKDTTASDSYKFRNKANVVTERKDCSCPNEH